MLVFIGLEKINAINYKGGRNMIYSTEVEHMCPIAKGAYHGPAPIPQEGKWVQAKEIKDISGLTHGVGWCAPQQFRYDTFCCYGIRNSSG